MSGNTGTDKEVILTVPFDADELDTVRLTLYGVAVRMGYTYEEIEDLKVALTEACNHALLQTPEKPPGGALRIVFTMRPAELVVRLEGAGCRLSFREADDSAAELPQSASLDDRQFESPRLGLYLMQALVDEVKVESGTGGASDRIELYKRLG